MKQNKLRIIVDILLIVIGFIFLIIGIKDAVNYFKDTTTDAEKFHKSYSSVSIEESAYKYIKLDELDNFRKDDNIILIGNETDPYMQVLVKPLNDLLKDTKVIYYIELNNLDKKSDSINLDDSPIIIKNEKVFYKKDIYHKQDDTILIEYWDEKNINKLNELIN